jgi:hypothetical protein
LPAISTEKGGIKCKKGGTNWKMTKFHSFSTVVAKLPALMPLSFGGIQWKFEHRLFSWWQKGGNW